MIELVSPPIIIECIRCGVRHEVQSTQRFDDGKVRVKRIKSFLTTEDGKKVKKGETIEGICPWCQGVADLPPEYSPVQVEIAERIAS